MADLNHDEPQSESRMGGMPPPFPTGKSEEPVRRRWVRRKPKPRIRWTPRDAARIEASTKTILTYEEPGTRIRLAMGIGALGMLLAAIVLVLVIRPRSSLPPIRTLHHAFKRAGVAYRVSPVHVGTEVILLHTVTISNLAPLRGIPIPALYVMNTNASDIGPLRGMPLEHLILRNTGVEDLSPLAGMPLRSLDILGTPVADLSPLQGMPLHYLGFEAGRITNGMDVIRQIPTLKLINRLPTNEFWRRYDRGDFRPAGRES